MGNQFVKFPIQDETTWHKWLYTKKEDANADLRLLLNEK
jgi:hypothetical protein